MIVLGLFMLPALCQSQGAPEFTGDMKLSCEAILCLSSGERPSECTPSLSRYFGINKDKWKDTVRARKDFLNICPDSSSEGMPTLVNAIANGAGRCDADYLNRTLYETKEVLECHSRGKEEDCNRVTYYRINNVLPAYCVSYVNHEWTDLNSTLRYDGSSEWIKKNSVSGWNNQGGKWVN